MIEQVEFRDTSPQQHVGGEPQAFMLRVPEDDPRAPLLQAMLEKLNHWDHILTGEDYALGRTQTTSSREVLTEYTGEIVFLQQDNVLVETPRTLAEQWQGGRQPHFVSVQAREYTIQSAVHEENLLEQGFAVFLNGAQATNSSLIDPYDNRPIQYLEIGIRERSHADIPYELTVKVQYGDTGAYESDTDVQEAAFFENTMSFDDTVVARTIQIDPGEEQIAPPTLLSGNIDDHTQALIDYLSVFVPPSTVSQP